MNKKLLGIGAAVAVAFAHYGTVAMAASVDGNADAEVIEPLTITETAAMDFGTVAGGDNAGTIIMTNTGARSVGSGDPEIIAAGPGSGGSFDITGEASQAITVSITGTATLDDGGGNTMTVNAFTSNNPTALDGSGDATLTVGGTLNIGANQTSGTYSTTTGGTPYTVTVNYN